MTADEPTVSSHAPLVARLARLLPFVLPVLFLAHEGSFVPLFDGSVYAECLVNWATHPSWAGLACANHPTHAWVLASSLLLWLNPSSTWLLLAGGAGMFLAGLWAFRRILEHLFPDPELRWERDLVTAILGTHPALLGCTLQPNPDLGVLSFSLLTLESLLAKKNYRAALFGVFLLFSKEIGCLCLAAMIAAYAVIYVTRGTDPVRARLKELRSLWPLAIPFVIFIGHALQDKGAFVPPSDNVGETESVASQFLSIRLLDGVFLSYAAGILVLQFQWLQSIVIVAWLALLAARWTFARPLFSPPLRARSLAFALTLFFAFFLLTTRYRTYSNVRYWISAYPPTLLAAYAGLLALGVKAHARVASLSVALVLTALSVHRTIDPVSKWTYGTFPFGEHEMLNMSSITSYPADKRVAGYGRDHLMYDLEFTKINGLQNAVMDYLSPLRKEPIVIDDGSAWHLWGPMDAKTLHRTLDPSGWQVPQMWFTMAMRNPPGDCYFVSYPPFAEIHDKTLATLENIYVVTHRESVVLDGYAVDVLSLHLDPQRWQAWRQH